MTMTWDVEYTDEFAEWWDILNEGEQENINTVVVMLEVDGPNLP